MSQEQSEWKRLTEKRSNNALGCVSLYKDKKNLTDDLFIEWKQQLLKKDIFYSNDNNLRDLKSILKLESEGTFSVPPAAPLGDEKKANKMIYSWYRVTEESNDLKKVNIKSKEVFRPLYENPENKATRSNQNSKIQNDNTKQGILTKTGSTQLMKDKANIKTNTKDVNYKTSVSKTKASAYRKIIGINQQMNTAKILEDKVLHFNKLRSDKLQRQILNRWHLYCVEYLKQLDLKMKNFDTVCKQHRLRKTWDTWKLYMTCRIRTLRKLLKKIDTKLITKVYNCWKKYYWNLKRARENQEKFKNEVVQRLEKANRVCLMQHMTVWKLYCKHKKDVRKESVDKERRQNLVKQFLLNRTIKTSSIDSPKEKGAINAEYAIKNCCDQKRSDRLNIHCIADNLAELKEISNISNLEEKGTIMPCLDKDSLNYTNKNLYHPIVSRMEIRAAERKEKRMELQRKYEEQERIRVKKIAQKKKELDQMSKEDATSRKQRIMEKKRQELLVKEERRLIIEFRRTQASLAVYHDKRRSLKTWGIVPWKKYVEQSKMLLRKSRYFYVCNMKRKIFDFWLTYHNLVQKEYAIMQQVKEQKAYALYKILLLKKHFSSWQFTHSAILTKNNYITSTFDRSVILKYTKIWRIRYMESVAIYRKKKKSLMSIRRILRMRSAIKHWKTITRVLIIRSELRKQKAETWKKVNQWLSE